LPSQGSARPVDRRTSVIMGTTDRTIEKQVIAAAMIEPDVDT
jgi:hypothetical protein